MTILCSSQIMAESAADSFIKFNKMEERHKKDWLTYCNDHHTQKTKLLENELHDWVALKNNHLKNSKNMMDCSAEAKDKKIAKHLDEAIKLHEEHKKKWKNWCDKMHTDAINIAKRHDMQLEKFKKEYRGMAEEMASVEDMKK